MRVCGGTEELALSNYHAGQTSDLLFVVRMLRGESGGPIFLAGFSMGGNVVLKLAGELGDGAAELIEGVCAVSTPLDLRAGVERLAAPANVLYEQRFLARLKDRIRKRARLPRSTRRKGWTVSELSTTSTTFTPPDYSDSALPAIITKRRPRRTSSAPSECPRSSCSRRTTP